MGAYQPFKSAFAAAQIDFIRVIPTSSTLTRSARIARGEVRGGDHVGPEIEIANEVFTNGASPIDGRLRVCSAYAESAPSD